MSDDRHSTYAAVSVTDNTKAIPASDYEALRKAVDGSGYTVKIGGTNAVTADINTRVSSDIGRAEGLSMPILLILLVFVFGSLVAALLPLAVGGLAILGSFTALKVISEFTDVSVFAVNIVTIMGLGLAIDYGLFMVSRFREELANGATVERAVARTMATAGRTVAVSAVTVAVSLSGLLLFPQTFLRSMGYGGIAAVVVAALAALTVLPALLAVLGHRVDALSVRTLLRRKPKAVVATEQEFWWRLAHSVMRRPAVYAVVIVAFLLFLAAPFLHVRFGGIDARVLPTSAESRQVSDTLSTDFPGNSTPLNAVLTLRNPVDSAAGQASVQDFVQRAQALPGAEGVRVAGAKGTTAEVDIGYSGQSLGSSAKDLLTHVRALPVGNGVSQVLVGGPTAEEVDLLHSLAERLPWMGLLIALATFTLLFLAFGSLVLPIKAIVMNVLSLGASFGAITWIFQEGHLSGFLGFTSTGTVEATQPILVFAIVFGLSMDYEVFLLSRMREQYDLTGDNTEAVAQGMQRSGRIITSAALLLIIVVGAFSTSSISFIKLIGVAMLIGIVVDATLVRSILVPATMKLLGNANWWAPKALRGLYSKYGISEDEDEGGGERERQLVASQIP